MVKRSVDTEFQEAITDAVTDLAMLGYEAKEFLAGLKQMRRRLDGHIRTCESMVKRDPQQWTESKWPTRR